VFTVQALVNVVRLHWHFETGSLWPRISAVFVSYNFTQLYSTLYKMADPRILLLIYSFLRKKRNMKRRRMSRRSTLKILHYMQMNSNHPWSKVSLSVPLVFICGLLNKRKVWSWFKANQSFGTILIPGVQTECGLSTYGWKDKHSFTSATNSLHSWEKNVLHFEKPYQLRKESL
jgi:hypothetical protein